MMVRHRQEVNCGSARRSFAMGRMVVNQGLQHGKKLIVGDFIGGRLGFSFRLRSRRAVVLPGRRVYQHTMPVAKLGAPGAARVPRALDALQPVSTYGASSLRRSSRRAPGAVYQSATVPALSSSW